MAEPKPSLWKPRAPEFRRIGRKPLFDWLEATTIDGADRARREIDALWQLVPPFLEQHFLSRLRSRRESDFYSAFCEMWHHRLLNTPPLSARLVGESDQASVPDLVVLAPDGSEFIVECYIRLPDECADSREHLERQFYESTWSALTQRELRIRILGIESTATLPSGRAFARKLEGLADTSPGRRTIGPYVDLGRHEYQDARSGWKLDFRLLRRVGVESGHSQLVLGQIGSAFYCRGEELLEKALDKKMKQHVDLRKPSVVSVAWNYFEHQPDMEDVEAIVRSKIGSLRRSGTIAVLWIGPLYPWGTPAVPTLYTWSDPLANSLRHAWPYAARNLT